MRTNRVRADTTVVGRDQADIDGVVDFGRPNINGVIGFGPSRRLAAGGSAPELMATLREYLTSGLHVAY